MQVTTFESRGKFSPDGDTAFTNELSHANFQEEHGHPATYQAY